MVKLTKTIFLVIVIFISIINVSYGQVETITISDLHLVLPDGSINGDRVRLFRNDEMHDRARVRLQMGDEQTYDYEIGFRRWEDGNWVTNFRLNGTGNGYFQNSLSIGTTNFPAGFSLSVNGKIRAKEVVVEAGWSDFVFEDNYPLKRLEDVEAFIKENKHLPDIPSEQDIQENGVSLGEINSKLLQKIEELTLYIIDQNKRLSEAEDLIKILAEKVLND